MRLFELVLLLVNVPLLTWFLWGRALRRAWRILPVVALLSMILQIVLEGARWHMIPGYLATVCMLGYCRPQAVQPGHWTAVVGMVLLLAAAALGTLLPVFQFPKPTGAYPVGTLTRHLVDASRQEPQSPRAPDYRELMIQVWYPAEWAGPGRPYRTRAETEFKKQHLALVKTNAATGVPIARAQARWPVVIFTPSWTGRRNQNTVQAEELASQGFVVVGIDHPYGTDLTIFPDGRVARTTLGEFLDCASEETLKESVRNIETQLQVRPADVRFVLDELERLDPSDPQDLAGRLDTSRVGIFGHSFGGAVAAEICDSDARFKAGINFDGFIFGEPTKRRLRSPFLYFVDDSTVPTTAELQAVGGPHYRHMAFIVQNVQYIRQSLPEREGYWLTIRGTTHMNFCDSPLYSPMKRLTRAGPIQPKRAMEIINAYVVSFFQKHLNGNDDRLFDRASARYPEVEPFETGQP
jgi:predicted dienelactone hydrolase